MLLVDQLGNGGSVEEPLTLVIAEHNRLVFERFWLHVALGSLVIILEAIATGRVDDRT